MEKATSYELEDLLSHKIKNDSMASGNPEDHVDSNYIEEVSGEPHIKDQIEENEFH